MEVTYNMGITNDPKMTELQLENMYWVRKVAIARARMYIQIVDVIVMAKGGVAFQPEGFIQELAEELIDAECEDLIKVFDKYNKPL